MKPSNPGVDASDARLTRPGYVLVRVAVRGPDGTPRDRAKALESLRGKPWFGELTPLGASGRFHLFERPE